MASRKLVVSRSLMRIEPLFAFFHHNLPSHSDFMDTGWSPAANMREQGELTVIHTWHSFSNLFSQQLSVLHLDDSETIVIFNKVKSKQRHTSRQKCTGNCQDSLEQSTSRRFQHQTPQID